MPISEQNGVNADLDIEWGFASGKRASQSVRAAHARRVSGTSRPRPAAVLELPTMISPWVIAPSLHVRSCCVEAPSSLRAEV